MDDIKNLATSNEVRMHEHTRNGRTWIHRQPYMR